MSDTGENDRQRLLCPRCESEQLIRRHCKTLCPRCGYVESCEDNFIPTQATPASERVSK